MLNKAKLQASDITFDDYLSFDIKKTWIGIRAEPWSFWFLCGYFFFEYTQVQKIYPWLAIVPWGQLFLLAALYCIFISKESKWNSNSCNVAIIILFLHVFISSLLAFDVGRSFDFLNIIANWAIMYYCVICIITTKKRFYVLMLLLLLACLKMSQHATISWAMRGFSFQRWGIAGAPVWFGDAADFGLQMCLYLAWAIAFLSVTYKSNGIYSKIFYLTMIITAFATIIAAGNRGTFLGVAAMGLSALLLLPNRIRNFFLIGALAAIVLWAAPQEFLDRFDTAGEDRTSLERLELWGNGIEMGKEHPFFGVGYQNFRIYGEYRYGTSKVAHNALVETFAELGYSGLVLYLYLVFTIYRVNRRTKKISLAAGDAFSSAVSTSLSLGLPAFIVCGLFISVQFYPFLYVQLALTAALNNIVRQKSNSEKKS